MSVYLLNLSIVSFSAFMGTIHKKYDKKTGDFVSKIYFLIATLSLVCVSGFRYQVGTDYSNYIDIYYLIGKENKVKLSGEFIFNGLIKVLTNITSNPQLLFFVTALITNVLIVRGIQKYSTNIGLSMYFFITTFAYYSTMNGIRQYIASALLFVAFKYIYEGNFKKYLICVVIATLIHQSAFIMIIVYFVARNKVDSKQNAVIIALFIVAIAFYQPFVQILSIFTKFTRFDNYIEVFQAATSGTNILRILVFSMPVMVMFIFRKRAREVFGQKVDILINMCFLGMLFMLLAWRQVYFARISMYFEFYYLLLIPLICSLFDKKTNRFITLLLMICYLSYSTILLVTGQSWIFPYHYNFNLF